MALYNMTDLDDRFEGYIFVPKRERIIQKWRVMQCHFMNLFLINKPGEVLFEGNRFFSPSLRRYILFDNR